MKKQIVKMGLVASMVLAGITAAHAGMAGRMTISGDVVSTSCDVDINGAGNDELSLGSWVAANFQTGAAPLAALRTVSNSAKTFNIDLKNCAGKGNGDVIALLVNGSTLTGQTSLFNEDPAASAGVAMTLTPDGGVLTAVADNGKYNVLTYGATDGAAVGDGTTIPVTAYLAAAGGTGAIAIQHVQAPIDFSIVNN